MSLRSLRPGRQHDETEQVIQHFSRTLDRVLDFLGLSIDDVVNDRRKRERVKKAYLLSLRIGRDLQGEPWRTEATDTLAETIRRRLEAGEDDLPGRGRSRKG